MVNYLGSVPLTHTYIQTESKIKSTRRRWKLEYIRERKHVPMTSLTWIQIQIILTYKYCFPSRLKFLCSDGLVFQEGELEKLGKFTLRLKKSRRIFLVFITAHKRRNLP